MCSFLLPCRGDNIQHRCTGPLDLLLFFLLLFFLGFSLSLRYSGFIEDISIEVGHSTVPYVLNLEWRWISVTVSICMYVEIILLLILSFIVLYSDRMHEVISIFLYLLRFYLCQSVVCFGENLKEC